MLLDYWIIYWTILFYDWFIHGVSSLESIILLNAYALHYWTPQFQFLSIIYYELRTLSLKTIYGHRSNWIIGHSYIIIYYVNRLHESFLKRDDVDNKYIVSIIREWTWSWRDVYTYCQSSSSNAIEYQNLGSLINSHHTTFPWPYYIYAMIWWLRTSGEGCSLLYHKWEKDFFFVL